MQRVCCATSLSAPRVLKPLLLFVMELSIGDRIFHIRSAGLGVPATVFGFLFDGHVELEYNQARVQAVNHSGPMDSTSLGIRSLYPSHLYEK